MADYTREQLLAGVDNAIAAGDLAAAQTLLAQANMLSPVPTTTMLEQGVSGANEGVAGALGTPVDLINAGLSEIGIGSEYPIGGSQSMKDLFQLLSGGNAISDVPPQTTGQQILRRTTQEVGGAVPLALGMAVAAPQRAISAAPTILNAGRNVLADIGTAYRAAPGKFAASEAAAAAGGGAAAGTTSLAFPDNATAETIAQLVGSLGGGLAANTVERLTTKTQKGPLTPEALKSAAGDLFDDVRQANMAFPSTSFTNVATRARDIAKDQGILLPNGMLDPDYTKVQGVLNILDLYSKSNLIDPAQVLATRQGIASRARDAAGTSEGVVLRRILKEFDDETSQLAPQIKVANAMYQRAMKGETLSDLLRIAEVNAGQYSQSGMENAVRGQFRELARKIVRGQEVGWTPEEVQAINQIAAGGTLDNALRYIGKFAPRGPVSASTGMGSVFAGTMAATRDPYIAGAAAGAAGATAMGANLAAGALQKRAVEDLVEKIIAGRPLTDQGKERMKAALTAYLIGAGAQQAQPDGDVAGIPRITVSK
jgi:hypothetical protein